MLRFGWQHPIHRHNSHKRDSREWRFLRSALEVVRRPLLFDGWRLNVEWNSCRKIYRHSHFMVPQFLARALLGDALPIYACAARRQAAWQPHALPPPSYACQSVVETLSELHLNVRAELLRCSSSTLLGNPYQAFHLFVTPICFVKMKCSESLKNELWKRRYQDLYLLLSSFFF